MKKVILNTDLCAKCRGRCCQSLPGCAMPEDFKPNVKETVLAALVSGQFAIDWFEGDPRDGRDELDRAYFVRPATTSGRRVFDASLGGICVFWRPSGCLLEPTDRPAGCRLVIPQPDQNCTCEITKRVAAIAWLDYNLKKIGHQAEHELQTDRSAP